MQEYLDVINLTDSYKLSQYRMLPEDTEKVYSYLEAREGAQFPETVFFGLEAILSDHLVGRRITNETIHRAKQLVDGHMGPGVFNEQGWLDIVNKNHGALPIRIWAQPEGSVHKPGTVLLIVENSGGPEFAWLTDYIETLLVQVWYPSTVASLSRAIKQDIAFYMYETVGDTNGIEFMLHDFGCRGASSMQSAAYGGMGHLVNFKGTDTVPAVAAAKELYGASSDVGLSVAAAQHSIMTALGRRGESQVVKMLLDRHPTGILANPIDSYDYVNFVDNIVGRDHYEQIMTRNGKYVLRPDSVSPQHPTPPEEMVWLLKRLYAIFGGSVNDRGYKVLDPHVGALWGDGIDKAGINKIMEACTEAGFAVTNYLFGMGGALLQKVNRDTQRFAYKCSAQRRNGEWFDIFKEPLDSSKTSKAGRFDNLNLPLVYENGQLLVHQNFNQIRERAAL